MNYVELHLGDWAQAVAHLSLVEEAVYLRLLRWYYGNEKPLPADLAACQRLAGARSQEEREAVAAVLAEFFTLTDEGHRNKRADEEIEKVRGKQAKAAASAKARWNANAQPAQCERNANASESDANAMRTQCERNALQSPDTNHKKEQKKEQGALATRLPKDWQPTPAELAWATKDRPEIDARAEAEKFRDYWHAQGGQRGRKTDWTATWRNWIRNARASPQAQRTQPNTQPSRQMAAILAIGGMTHDQIFDAPRVVPEPDSTGLDAVLRAEHARLPGR